MKGLAFAFVMFLGALLFVSLIFLMLSNPFFQIMNFAEGFYPVNETGEALGVLSTLKTVWAYGWVMVLVVALIIYLVMASQRREPHWGYGGYG